MSDAFADSLVARRHNVRSLACRYFAADDDIADAVQDTMLKALTYPPRHTNDFAAWLNSVTHSVCIDELRRRKRRIVAADVDGADVVDCRQSLNVVLLRETIAELHAMMDDRQWRIFVLIADGYDLAEIAALLGLPVGTVKSRMHYGRMRAKDWRNSVA